MSTVRSADGTTIAYTRAGQGPPLILVDGALCSRSFGPMPKLAGQLTPHFTVYTYDRRGRGSSGDTKPYSPDREIEDIEALVALAGDTCTCTARRPAPLWPWKRPSTSARSRNWPCTSRRSSSTAPGRQCQMTTCRG